MLWACSGMHLRLLTRCCMGLACLQTKSRPRSHSSYHTLSLAEIDVTYTKVVAAHTGPKYVTKALLLRAVLCGLADHPTQ